MNRTTLGLACGATLLATAGALGQQAAPAHHAPSSQGKAAQPAVQVRAQSGTTPSKSRAAFAGADLLHRLAGEWEGQVQVRGADGMTSASIISASNRLEDNNQRLASCLTGMAFAKPFDGAAVIRVSGSDLSSSWADSINTGAINAVAHADQCEADSATFSGRVSRGADASTIEQSLTMTSENSFVLELNSVSDSGRRMLVVRLDMSRLPSGKVAAAGEKFKDAPLLARLRAGTPSAQASVKTDN